jgi:hypothetical protein
MHGAIIAGARDGMEALALGGTTTERPDLTVTARLDATFAIDAVDRSSTGTRVP